MDIRAVIEAIRRAPGCAVVPPRGLPSVEPPHLLPDDVANFYTACGGLTLFRDAAFPLRVVPPEEFTLANPEIVRGVGIDRLRASDPESITWSWYIVARGYPGQYMTIDLARERLGRCYDSRWDRHAEDSAIIALSLTELLSRSLHLSNQGEHYYWSPPYTSP